MSCSQSSCEDLGHFLRSSKYLIMVSEISIFTLAVDNLLFNCDQCYKTNSSKKGLTQHLWIKQYYSTYFRHFHLDYCSQVYKENT